MTIKESFVALTIALAFILMPFTANSDEIVCHFDLETDPIGTPSCDKEDCVFAIEFPNYGAAKIMRAHLKHKAKGQFLSVDLSLERIEEKAYSTLYFSKTSTIFLEAYYDLNGCVGRTIHEISNGQIKQTE